MRQCDFKIYHEKRPAYLQYNKQPTRKKNPQEASKVKKSVS